MTPRILITAGFCLLIIFLGAQQASVRSPAPTNQTIRAPAGLNVWLLGVHPMAEDPDKQMLAHHLCGQVEPELMQCALYESNLPGARLTGIEYIIPEERFEELPAEEKQYWHPHNFEILSGVLTAPNHPEAMALLERKTNSYGKTFHTWMAGTVSGEAQDFPYGKPMLAWSLNKEGEMGPEMEAAYRERGLDLEAMRKERRALAANAEPQCGVDALAGQFPGEASTIDGVEAKSAGCPDYAFTENSGE